MKTIEEILREIKSGNASDDSLVQMGEMIQAILDDSRKSMGLDVDKFSATALGAIIDNKIKLLEEERDNLEDFVDVDQEIQGLTQELLDTLKGRLMKMYEAGEINSEEAQILKRLVKKYAHLSKTQDKFNQGLEKGNAAAKQLLQATLGLSTEWSFLSDTGGFSGLWQGIKKGMAESLSFTNIMSSLVSKVVERAFEFDKLQAELFKKTGIKREEVNLHEMNEDLRGMGSDYAQVGTKALIDLQNQFKDYQSFTDGEAKLMKNVVAVLGERGAASKDTIDSMDALVKAVGFTGEETAQILLNQAAIAEESQRPIDEQLSEFSQGMTNLARFGKDSVNILNKMKMDANKANVELRTLLGLSEKADTFEGAAQMAQAFNVAIAGPMGAALLNPLELVGASMEQKINILQNKYREAGSPTLSPRVLRELSASFQVPENELLKIFNVEASKVGAKQQDASSAQTTLKEQTDLIRKQKSAQEKLNAAMVKIADDLLETVGGPNGIIAIVDTITDGINFIADNIYTVAGGLLAVKGLMLARSYRGATPMNPEFIFSQGMGGPGGAGGGGGKGRGRLGTVLTAIGIVGTGIAGGMAIDAATSDSSPTQPAAGAGVGTGGVSGYNLLGGNAARGLSSPGGGVNATMGDDTMAGSAGNRSINIPAGKSPPMSVSSNYVAPQVNLVHKDDKLYFAKGDGALMQKIDEAKQKLLSNSEKKAPTVIRISKREFRQMISEALGDVI